MMIDPEKCEDRRGNPHRGTKEYEEWKQSSKYDEFCKRMHLTGKDHPNYGKPGSMLGKKHTQEARRKMSKEWVYEKHFTDDCRRKISIANSGRHHSDETRRKMSEIALEINRNRPDEVKDEIRKKLSESNKNPSEETRRKMSESKLGDRCSAWRGGISFLPYCQKFNREFKDRVRAFFGYRCIECGKTEDENGKKLHVHHVNYDKMVCCNDVKPLFVALCTSHNSKANFNRTYWEDHYTTIVNERYGGQCYLPKEEFR